MNDLLSSFRLLFFQYLKQLDNAKHVDRLADIAEEKDDFVNTRKLQDQSSELHQTVRLTRDRIEPFVAELLQRLREIKTTLSANQILTDDLVFCQSLHEFILEQEERFDKLPMTINFLNLLENELDQIFTILESSEKKGDVGLENIFQDGCFSICTDLFLEFGIKDQNGVLLVKNGRGTDLFAIISAIGHYSRRLLIRKYNESELLNLFNNYLGTSFKQLKKTGVSYKKTREDAENMIKVFTKPK